MRSRKTAIRPADKHRGSDFVGTGNKLSVPTAPAYLACVAGGGTAATCNSPQNHVDSVLSLDIGTGAVKWAFRAMTWNNPFIADGSDNWNVACAVGFGLGQGKCPAGAGPALDFASAPNLITCASSTGKQTILGAGQNTGSYRPLMFRVVGHLPAHAAMLRAALN